MQNPSGKSKARRVVLDVTPGRQLTPIAPRQVRVFLLTGECFKQLPHTDDSRHTDDACSPAGDADGTCWLWLILYILYRVAELSR